MDVLTLRDRTLNRQVAKVAKVAKTITVKEGLLMTLAFYVPLASWRLGALAVNPVGKIAF